MGDRAAPPVQRCHPPGGPRQAPRLDQTFSRYSASPSGRANAIRWHRATRPPRHRADPGPGSVETRREEPVVRTDHDANRDGRPCLKAADRPEDRVGLGERGGSPLPRPACEDREHDERPRCRGTVCAITPRRASWRAGLKTEVSRCRRRAPPPPTPLAPGSRREPIGRLMGGQGGSRRTLAGPSAGDL